MKYLWMFGFLVTLSGCNGCASSRSASRTELRRTIVDTNEALSNADQRADGYQRAAQKFARLYYKLKHKRS